MLLSSLDRKEKLKFLDLALHMVLVDGDTTKQEERLLNMMLAEVGDDIIKEYRYSQSSNLEETIQYFKNRPILTKRVVFLNLMKVSMIDDFYNTNEHFFLDDLRKSFSISVAKRKELLAIVFEERDLKEKAKKACLQEWLFASLLKKTNQLYI